MMGMIAGNPPNHPEGKKNLQGEEVGKTEKKSGKAAALETATETVKSAAKKNQEEAEKIKKRIVVKTGKEKEMMTEIVEMATDTERIEQIIRQKTALARSLKKKVVPWRPLILESPKLK